jgi:hypothetical protein
MKLKLISRIVALNVMLLGLPLTANCQEQVNKRAEWFIDARYGMFIHWGIYSGAEGVWKGEKHRDDNNKVSIAVDEVDILRQTRDFSNVANKPLAVQVPDEGYLFMTDYKFNII